MTYLTRRFLSSWSSYPNLPEDVVSRVSVSGEIISSMPLFPLRFYCFIASTRISPLQARFLNPTQGKLMGSRWFCLHLQSPLDPHSWIVLWPPPPFCPSTLPSGIAQFRPRLISPDETNHMEFWIKRTRFGGKKKTLLKTRSASWNSIGFLEQIAR